MVVRNRHKDNYFKGKQFNMHVSESEKTAGVKLLDN